MVKRCLMSSPSAFACVAVSSETAVWCIKKRGVVEIRVGKQQIRVGKQQIRVGKGKIRVGTPAQVIFTPHHKPPRDTSEQHRDQDMPSKYLLRKASEMVVLLCACAVDYLSAFIFSSALPAEMRVGIWWFSPVL